MVTKFHSITLQIYQPDESVGEKLLIRELKYPMIEQPSRAQLLNLVECGALRLPVRPTAAGCHTLDHRLESVAPGLRG